MKFLNMQLLLVTCCSLLFSAQIITDSSFKYSVYLPDHWVREVINTNQHTFHDTTYALKSQVSILRRTYSTTDYATPAQWAVANFLAYKIVAENTFDPMGVVLYSDSTITHGALKAAEAYSVFFSADTMVGSWSELIRFTATPSFGYELYALGDTADMRLNVGAYAALINGFVIEGFTPVQQVLRPVRATKATSPAIHVVDIMGRITRLSQSPGINYSRYKSSLSLIRR
jgi:hypothetical protein